MNARTAHIAMESIRIAFMVFWIYVAIDKLMEPSAFQAALLRQPLPSSWAKPLSLTLPAIELATGTLLAGRYKKIGLLLSIALLSSFSVYIALGLLNLYPQKPCGCASVFESLSWEWHLVVNMVLFTLSILGWYLTGPTSPMERHKKRNLSIGFTFIPPIHLGIVTLCLYHTSQIRFPRKFALFPAWPV